MSNSRVGEGNTNEVSNRQTLKCGIAEPPLAQGLQSHGRAGGHSSATAHPQHTRNWHLRAGNCCGTALAECPGCASPSDVTQICSTGRFWKPSPHPICSPAVRHGANTGEGKPDRISTDSGKEKGFQFATPGHYLLSRAAGKELH